jgi:uncharacterized membrane protein YdbT with pleckstrin-like domain
MAIPLNHWYRLGKKIFWIFIIRSGWFFVLLFGLLSWFTYNIFWGTFGEPFKQFFQSHPNWYIESNFALGMFWLIMLGYFIVVILRAWVLYRQYKFMLDENAFHVRRGIFFIKEIVIPYHHIQNVEIKQPYLYRFIGLAELDITTLGGSGSSFLPVQNNKHKKSSNLLPVIDRKMAKALAHELVNRGSAKEKPSISEQQEELNQITETQ